jgi:DNA-binding SARP family transcriptional activator
LPEELAEFIRMHPLRETLTGHLMMALDQLGRPSEAFAAFHELRVALSRELGIASSPALQGLYESLVKDSPSFETWLGGWMVAS